MAKNKNNGEDLADESTLTDQSPVPAQPQADSGKRITLDAFLDGKEARKYGKSLLRAFRAGYRTEPARSDWIQLLKEFSSAKR